MKQQEWEKKFDSEWYLWDYSKKLNTYNTCGEAVKVFIRQLLDEQEEEIIRLVIRHYSEFTEEVWTPYRGSKTCGEVAIEWFKKLDE